MITTTNIISIVYQTLLLVIGVPGNILIILTYWNRQQRTSAGVFIIALALADLGVCLMSPVAIYGYVVYYDFPSEGLCKFRFYTNHGLIYVSRFLTIAVAIERYLAVCKPMSKRISPKWAAVISVACVPVGYILTIPIAIAFGLKELPGGRGTICYPDTSNPAIYWVFKINFPITFLGGLIVVVVCYSLIYRAIRRQMAIRSHMMSSGPRPSGIAPKSTDDTTTTTTSSSKKTAQTSFVVRESEVSKSSLGDLSSTVQQPNPSSRIGDQGVPNGESRPDDSTSASTTDVKVAVAPTKSDSAAEGVKGDVEKGTGDQKGERATDESSRSTSCKKKSDKKSKSKSKSNSMDSTTKMLLIVTVIYFASFLPQLITLMIPRSAMRDFQINYKKLFEFFVFIRRLITINHIINPFVYGFVNKRFRQDCLATLKSLKAKCCWAN